MNGRSGLMLSSYAAAPAIDGWSPAREAAFLSAVAALPHLRGLEIPLYASGSLHKYDGDWFLEQLRHLPEHFEYVVTTIPATMDRLGSTPAFGLASTQPDGRGAALAGAGAAAAAVGRLNDVLGRKAVRAVHLFSAPRSSSKAGGHIQGINASVQALAGSLKQLATYDWDGAWPVVEHCDAGAGRYRPVKGFLPLEAEVEAAVIAGAGTGIAVNWARSVIEDRDPGAPDRHVRLALQAGVLAGVVLSGCSPRPTAFGGPWDDTHLPPEPVEPASVLTTSHIRGIAVALEDAGAGEAPQPYRGLKVSAPRGSSVKQRLSVLADSIAAVHHAGF